MPDPAIRRQRSHAIVIPPCHFEGPDTLCNTTLARITVALAVGRALDSGETLYVPLGGAVRYKPGSETLGTLTGHELASRGIPQERILVPQDGVGTFAEARSATRLIDEKLPDRTQKMISVVSSDWWLSSGEPVWRQMAYFVRLNFLPVMGTGGKKTRRLYSLYGRLIRMAYWLGCEHELEHIITTFQKRRMQRFTWNGCA